MYDEEGLRPVPIYDLAPIPQRQICVRYLGCEAVARLHAASRQPQGMAALSAMCEQFPGYDQNLTPSDLPLSAAELATQAQEAIGRLPMKRCVDCVGPIF